MMFNLCGQLLDRFRRPLCRLFSSKKYVLLVGAATFIQIAMTSGFAQRISLNEKSKPLTVVFKKIKEQSGFHFFWKGEKLDDRIVSVQVTNVNFEEALQKVFEGTGLQFQIEKNTVIVSKKLLKEDYSTKTGATIQQRVLTGKVIDKRGQKLSGVSIKLGKGNRTYLTDDDGGYKLTFSDQIDSIQFSYIGFQTITAKIPSTDVLDVTMIAEVSTMKDVVVTGLYTRRKDSFTGSASTFSGKELKEIGVQNIIQSLKTLDPAFMVLESNQFGSDPNRLPDIEIRGKTSVIGLKEQFGTDPNQPLFILDGFEASLRTIVDLNMERVASVTILKDAASAAIYGAKAANGVVVIETKEPEAGKLKVSYAGDFSVFVPDLSGYNLMNASEKIEFELKAGYYTAQSSEGASQQLLLDSLYNSRLANINRGVNTYWMSEPLRTSISHKHNIYAEGGDQQIRYGVGVNYNAINGVMKGSTRDIFGGNFDLHYRKGKLLIYNKLTLDYNNANNPAVPFSEYSRANPYFRKTNEDGVIERFLDSYPTLRGSLNVVGNPLWNERLNNLDNENQFSFNNNLNMEWRLLKSLYVRGRFGLGKGMKNNEKFQSPQHSMFESYAQDKKGRYNTMYDRNNYYDGDMAITYGALLGNNHRVSAVLGGRLRSNSNIAEGYTLGGFPVGNFTKPPFGHGFTEGSKPSYSESTNRSNSFYFNGGYALLERYLLDLNLRLDGSSVFGSNKRYSETWALGLAWNLHNETFFKDQSWLNLFKLRGSIGNPGNQNFSAYQSVTSYLFTTWLSNSFGPAVLIDKVGNPDLKWQKTLDKNLGFDLSLFGNRFHITADLYNKNTDPLLVYISTPSSVGVTEAGTNMGGQYNKGISGTIKYSPIYKPTDRINWTLSLNARHQTAYYNGIGNKLNRLNEENRSNTESTYLGNNSSLVRYYDGGSPTALWTVKSMGIDPSSGKEIFQKKDGTYTFVYNVEDEVIVGDSQPKLEGVIGSTLYLKGFSFSAYIRYKFGGDIFNNSLYTKVENISANSLAYNQDKRALYDRWQKPGDQASFKGISLTEITKISSRFVQRENMISGESFSIGYDVNKDKIQRIGFSSLRLQANMNDVFRISTVKTERGIDYPFARTISMSISATF